MTEKTLIVIVGPTAIGKTALSIQLAQKFGTEIISTDSRQFFREMNIGTAKPSEVELAAVPHHFINSHSITEYFSTGDFEVAALSSLAHLFQKHEVIIAVGGSGLYVNALCKGLDEMPETDLAIREKLMQQFENEGIEPIREQLKKLDPQYFAKVDPSNTQRIIRGLEMVLSSGQKMSDLHTAKTKQRPFRIIKIGLNIDRELLYQRINHRVDVMMQDGLLAEVEKLYPYRDLNALKTVGYSELFDYLDEKSDLETAVAKIKQNTRRFAKRQLTWFRRDSEIHWFSPSNWEQIVAYLSQQLT